MSYMEPLEVGIKVLTASGVVGDSGKAIAVYGYHFLSGGTLGNVTLKNGTDTNGTAIMGKDGTANKWAEGLTAPGAPVFPSGCYASFDANVTSCSVYYRQILTA